MRRSLSTALLIFVAVLAFYTYTLSPALPWGDAARMQLEVALGGSTYFFLEDIEQAFPVDLDTLPFARLGVAAWDHPVYVMLGRLFLTIPWWDGIVAINWMSALAGAVTVLLTYETGKYLSGDWRAAFLGALALAVSHTFWWHSVNAEVYTLHLAFMMSLLAINLRWLRNPHRIHLLLYSFLAGLGLANHLLLGITLIASIVYTVRSAIQNGTIHTHRHALRPAWLIACILLFIIGLSPWWIQFIRFSRLIDLPLILKVVFGYPWVGESWQVLSFEAIIRNFLAYGGWLFYQFTPVGILLGVYGYANMRRRWPRETELIAVLFILHATFSANFAVLDQFALHLLSYPCFALFIMGGVAAFLKEVETRLPLPSVRKQFELHTKLMAGLIVLPVTIYTLTPHVLRVIGVTEANLNLVPIGANARDIFAVFLNPNRRGDFSATQFGRGTLTNLAPNALVLTPNNVDGEAYVVLRYFQLVEHLRPDVRFELLLFHSPETIPQDIMSMVRSQRNCRPIYLVSLNPSAYPFEQLQAEFQITPEANIYRLVPHDPPVSTRCPNVERGGSGMSLQQRLEHALQWR